MQVLSASLAAQDQLLSGADRRLVQTLASVQEVGQAVSQAGARAQESVEQAGARAWEGIEQARESAKQTGSAVADGAQAAGLAVSAGVQSAVPAVRDVSKKVVTGAAEVHQDIVQAHGDGGTSAAAERTAVHAAKAAIGAYAGYVGATAAAKTKAAEVGMIASHYVHDSVSEGTQQKLQEGASRALQGAKYLADVVATHGESAVKQGYASYVQASEIITAATEEAYAGLPEEKRQAILDKRRRVDDSKEHIKELGMTLARPLWKSVSASAGSALRDSVLSDPDMWPCVRRLCGPLMEELWHDIDEEILKGVELSIYKDPPPQDDGPRVGPLLRLRAFVLHHFLPHDRSIFGMLKDPVYLIFLAITFVPFWSARVGFYSLILLLLWAAPDGVDEYQLTSFVLSAKGMQFLTSGVVNNAYGAADYYIALHVCDGDQDCILRHTPGQNTSVVFPVIDFFGSVCLVWAAFWLLPRSTGHGLRSRRAAARQQRRPELISQVTSARAVDAETQARGGRLRVVLRWDLMSFGVCCLGLLALHFVGASFLTNLFWCRVVYSLLSFPFFFFYLPGFRQLLTHAEPTGFAADGRCVPYQLRQLPAAQQPLLGARSGPADSGAAPSSGIV